jgi:hypothetical protein
VPQQSECLAKSHTSKDILRIFGAYSRPFEEERLGNEYRFARETGGYCWVSDELQVLRNAPGDPTAVVGACSDITARKAKAWSLRHFILPSNNDAFSDGGDNSWPSVFGPRACS